MKLFLTSTARRTCQNQERAGTPSAEPNIPTTWSTLSSCVEPVSSECPTIGSFWDALAHSQLDLSPNHPRLVPSHLDLVPSLPALAPNLLNLAKNHQVAREKRRSSIKSIVWLVWMIDFKSKLWVYQFYWNYFFCWIWWCWYRVLISIPQFANLRTCILKVCRFFPFQAIQL